MPQGKALSVDLHDVILNMSMYLSINQIRDYTGITKQTIYRILQDFRRRGSVAQAHLMQSLQGQKRSLTTTDVRVWKACYHKKKDDIFAHLFAPFLFAPLHASSFKVLSNIAQVCTSMRWETCWKCGVVYKSMILQSGRLWNVLALQWRKSLCWFSLYTLSDLCYDFDWFRLFSLDQRQSFVKDVRFQRLKRMSWVLFQDIVLRSS